MVKKNTNIRNTSIAKCFARKVLPGNMIRLFVYGTLKKGFRLDHFMSGATFVSKAVLNGYIMFDVFNHFYPVAMKHKGRVIHGEIYKVPISSMRKIVDLEQQGRLEPKIINMLGKDTIVFIGDEQKIMCEPLTGFMRNSMKEVVNGIWTHGKTNWKGI